MGLTTVQRYCAACDCDIPDEAYVFLTIPERAPLSLFHAVNAKIKVTSCILSASGLTCITDTVCINGGHEQPSSLLSGTGYRTKFKTRAQLEAKLAMC